MKTESHTNFRLGQLVYFNKWRKVLETASD